MLASPPAGAWFCVGEKTRYKCQHDTHTRLSKNCHAFAEGLVSEAAGVGDTPPPGILRLWLVVLASRLRGFVFWSSGSAHSPARTEAACLRQAGSPPGDDAFRRSRLSVFWAAAQSGEKCLLGNLEGTKNQINRLLPSLGRLISVRGSLS